MYDLVPLVCVFWNILLTWILLYHHMFWLVLEITEQFWCRRCSIFSLMSNFETLLLQTKYVCSTSTTVCLMSTVKEILHPPNLNQFDNKYSIILLIVVFAFSKVVENGWLVSVYLQSVIVSQILTFETNEVVEICHISVYTNLACSLSCLKSPRHSAG